MQKRMEIAGSEVWAASRMVVTFTMEISLPLPPIPSPHPLISGQPS